MAELDFTPHQERITLFADLVLPIPLPRLFTYRVPYELNDYIKLGCRVVVQFGSRRVVTGIVAHLHQTRPDYATKYILELLDEYPVVTPQHIQLWQWIGDYYMCNIGDVMGVALPSGMKLSSTSKIQLHPHFDIKTGIGGFSKKEQKLLKMLQNAPSLSHDDVAELLDVKNIYDVLKKLISQEAIIIYEEVREKYRPKVAKRVRFTKEYMKAEKLQTLFAQIGRYQKQEQILVKYVSKIPIQKKPSLNKKGFDKIELLASSGDGQKLSTSALKTLVKNGVFEEFVEVVPRFPIENMGMKTIEIELTPTQNQAVSQIFTHFQEKDAVLLHGVTGSGKTEVYIHLIHQVLQSGSQVLLLLPEIALTIQMVVRLKKVFGDKMGVYHSRFSDNERVEVWKAVQNGTYSFVVGVRSAIFLPFDNLGLIIVDEEHDSSYKQHDPAPRYNARDLSLVLAKMQGGKILMGSATPSVETYYLAKQNVYGLVKLTERFGEAQLPDNQLVDTRKARQEKRMQSYFSPELIEQTQHAIAREEQVILFQNRRGYAPFLSCEICAWTPKCENCSVSLTYHLHNNEVRCHYCGYTQKTPNICIACGSTKIKTMQFGTEKIEDDLNLLLPTARTQRMDRDTTRNKTSYERIISAFEKHEVDILVGTQMVTKGLDFGKVNLVGVFDVDRMLHFPDFRSFERTFQLITQVSGRAGRRGDKGLVLIQTANPKQLILKRIVENDFIGFFDAEVIERERFLYPPFSRLIKLIVKSENQTLCIEAAKDLSEPLKKELGTVRVLGPETPLIDRIRNKYLQEIIIKLERQKINLKAVKKFLREEITTLTKQKMYKKIQVVVDVDPI